MQVRILAAVLMAVVLSAGEAEAQMPLYLTGGVTFADVSGDDLGDTEPKTGFFVGAGTGFALNDRFTVDGHVVYVQKGAAAEVGDGELALDYIEIPVFLSTSVPLTETVNLGLSAGAGVGFKINCEFTDSDGESFDCDDDSEDIDFGLLGSAGIGFQLTETVGAVVGVGYELGLTNVSTLEDEDLKNRVFYLFAGIGIPLGG